MKMHVRARREGVEEVFAHDRVATIMQQAVAHRYLTPSSVTAATTATAPITRLHTPEHYTLRPFSRTEHVLTSKQRSCVCTRTNSEHESSWWCEGTACVTSAVVAECMRHRLFFALMQTDLREACGLPDGPSSGTGSGQGSAEFLASWQEFFELPPRWVMQSLGAVDQHSFTSAAAWQTRDAVTPLDVGATVALRRPHLRHVRESEEVKATRPPSPAAPQCVVATAPMAGGAYWVDIAPTYAPSAVRRVDRDDVMLSPPVHVRADPLLPCDELYSARGVNTSVYVFFLRALQQQQRRQRARLSRRDIGEDIKGNGDGQASPAAAAAAVSLRLARCAQQRRAQLEDRLHRHPPDSGEVKAGEGPVRLQVRVDVARACVQLRACVESPAHPNASASAPGSLVGTTMETVARRKRQRSDAEPVCTDGSSLWEKVESPVVEVLLRSAWKLAALYDATRASAWAHRGGEDSAWPTAAATVAKTTLEQFVRQAEATGVSSAWHTVQMNSDNAEGERGETTTRCTTAAGGAFLARLFSLLLRYRTLFGEQGYNQGPQAAVPPPIMEELAASFDIAAEAFASPLNAQLPQFGSLFPDTDAYFGSMGSFFDIRFGGGTVVPPVATATTTAVLKGCHVEVNPPFDTTLLSKMEARLLSCLSKAATSTQSLLFLIVLPSHDLDGSEMSAGERSAGGANARLGSKAARPLATAAAAPSGGGPSAVPISTDRSLRESPYCLAHVLCAAAESVYVDGHQHLLESPFFCIGTPTRLILLGNAAARARFPDANTQLERVRRSWRELTAGALKS